MRTYLSRAGLVLVVLASILLAACNSATVAPTAGDGPTSAPQRTAKPTFTPISEAAATLAPTITEAAPADTQEPAGEPAGEPADTPTDVAQGAQETAPTDDEAEPAAEDPATVVPPTAEPTARQAKSLTMASPEYGMQVFPWWRTEVGSRDIQLVSDAGFGWAKVNFGWRDIEGAGKGALDWSHTDAIVEMAAAENIDLVVRIDHQPQWAGGGYPTNGPPDNMQDLADFMTQIVSRYKGRVRAWEVWNEPNLAREWGNQLPDPTEYAQMLKVAYAAIKAADPNAMVISAGLSPTGTWNDVARPDDWYLETLYVVMGSSNGYFDVLGAHGPGYLVAPETDPATVAADSSLGGDRSMCFRRVEDLRAIMVKYGDSAKQVALLEFGWTSDPRADSPYNWHAVSEETKADYLVRAYQYAEQNWSPWIGLMSLIYIADPDWTENDEQYWWAITDPGWPEFHPRPAYTALKAMAK